MHISDPWTVYLLFLGLCFSLGYALSRLGR
jgi:hypothetical protein